MTLGLNNYQYPKERTPSGKNPDLQSHNVNVEDAAFLRLQTFDFCFFLGANCQAKAIKVNDAHVNFLPTFVDFECDLRDFFQREQCRSEKNKTKKKNKRNRKS